MPRCVKNEPEQGPGLQWCGPFHWFENARQPGRNCAIELFTGDIKTMNHLFVYPLQDAAWADSKVTSRCELSRSARRGRDRDKTSRGPKPREVLTWLNRRLWREITLRSAVLSKLPQHPARDRSGIV